MRWIRAHPIYTAVTLVLGFALGTGAFIAARALTTFHEVASVDFQPDRARQALADTGPVSAGSVVTTWPQAQLPTTHAGEYDVPDENALIADLKAQGAPPGYANPKAISPKLPDKMFTSILLVGSDASGHRADVIVYVLLPSDGSRPIVVSLPRDLYVPDLCHNTYNRINANLGGCRGVASGSEMLAIAVEEFTGVKVDHLARLGFAGFATVVDRLGGITVCVKYPTRDLKSHLDIGTPGCQTVNGATALAWVRSRHTEQLIGGVWKGVAGSDFARQAREQDVLFQFAAKLSHYSSPTALAGAFGNLASAVRVDKGWSLPEMASLAWRYRGVKQSSVTRLSLKVRNYRTPRGALVLEPTASFNELLSAVYPKAVAS